MELVFKTARATDRMQCFAGGVRVSYVIARRMLGVCDDAPVAFTATATHIIQRYIVTAPGGWAAMLDAWGVERQKMVL